MLPDDPTARRRNRSGGGPGRPAPTAGVVLVLDEEAFVDELSARAGDLGVPVGIDIKGGAAGEEMRSFEEIMAGTTVVVGVDEQGRACLHLTDDDLAQSTRALSDWIAAQG